MTSHLALQDEHIAIYSCSNPPKGHTIYLRKSTRMDEGILMPKGRTTTHYLIDDVLYRNKNKAHKKLMEL
ncbi:MAG: hypothetical protein ACI36Z_03180 [Alloprevotella sp.]